MSKFLRFSRQAARRLMVPYRRLFKGQISSKNEIGKWITLLASLAETKMIVEIGVAYGRGTSKMILKGLRSKPGDVTQVIGLESNPLLYRKAKKYLSKFPNYILLWGSIVLPSELDKCDLSSEETDWLAGDLRDLENAPYILDKLPDSIDLLILDGGEFSTFAEFRLLNNRVAGWVILDDTKTRKCSEVLKLVKGEKRFEVIYESEERHGTAVLKRLQGVDDQ